MDKHRVFLSINLPEKVKNRLSNYQEKLNELPAKWVKKDNLHITLIFLGYVSEKEIGKVCSSVKEEVLKHSSFDISLEKISYFPEGKIPPRMVASVGESSQELSDLRKDLERSLLDQGVHFPLEMKKFKPHITLGRIRAWDWRRIEPDERPEAEEEINMEFKVDSVEVMESKLKRGGPKYIILESAKLSI